MITYMETPTNTNCAIADSSLLVSLFSPTDAYHAHALELARQAQEDGLTILTPEAVVIETINILGKKLGHDPAAMAAERILKSGDFSITFTGEMMEPALVKFKASK